MAHGDLRAVVRRMDGGGVTRVSIRPALVKYLTDHPGEVLHVGDIMEDLGLNRAQVQQGMTWMMDKGLATAMVRGSSWTYRPPKIDRPVDGDPEPGQVVRAVANGVIEEGQLAEIVADSVGPGDLMEVIRCLKNGDILLEDNDGTLFVATRLEIK